MDFQPLIRKAQSKGVGVIGSFHDFQSTPMDEVLRGAVDVALQFRFDAVKIATMLQSPADLGRLVTLAATEKRLPISIMGMGPWGGHRGLCLRNVVACSITVIWAVRMPPVSGLPGD
nr:type I 3-dehydroquinate dehydratase [Verrucomicrobium spinosum]